MILSHSQMIQAVAHVTASAASATEKIADNSTSTNSSMSPPSCLFPTKLYNMLEDASREGFNDVVRWMPGGATFKVLETTRFTNEVMPRYFNQRKYKSFLRQLNLYGFSRIHHGPHKGGYAHKDFLQGAPHLCDKINKSNLRVKDRMAKTHRRVVSSETYAQQQIYSIFSSHAEVSQRTKSNYCNPSFAGEVDGVTVSDIDDSASVRSINSSITELNQFLSPNVLTPLPIETPVNTTITQEAINHILPQTSNFAQNTAINEIFHEDHHAFHAMDTQVEKALLSIFVSDDREMEKDIGVAVIDGDSLDMEEGVATTLSKNLLAIVDDEPISISATTTRKISSNGINARQPCAPVPSANGLQAPIGVTSPLQMKQADRALISTLAMGAFSEFNFPRKIYRMLEDAEKNSAYKEIVSWTEEGMAFTVHNKKMFVEKILPIYFEMSQYASFRRQLNMYSFERKHTSTYSNPFFLRGCSDLLEKIIRKTGKKKTDNNKK